MELKKSLLIATMALFAASGLFAKNEAKKTEVPGVAPQPAEFFYTGKPYDADLGAYTFNYRNYDPELKRWTTADPSGFPDGANNRIYAPIPTFAFDDTGLSSKRLIFTYGGSLCSIQYDVTVDEDNGVTLNSATVSALNSCLTSVSLSNTKVSNAQVTYGDDGSTTWTWDNDGTLNLLASIGVKITWPITADLTINRTYSYPYSSTEKYTFE